MKELAEYIVKQIVSSPESVSIDETISGNEILLRLKVADSDMGMVIGKKGQTIRAIRRLLGVRAMNDGVRVNLTLVDGDHNAESTGNAAEEMNEEMQVSSESDSGSTTPS